MQMDYLSVVRRWTVSTQSTTAVMDEVTVVLYKALSGPSKRLVCETNLI